MDAGAQDPDLGQVCVLLGMAVELASGRREAAVEALRDAERWLRSWEVAADPPRLAFLGGAAATAKHGGRVWGLALHCAERSCGAAGRGRWRLRS